MLQWIIGFWVSHGQVLWQWICCCVIWNYYMKICLLKPQYFFEELPGPFIRKELCFLPSLHIFNSTKLCTDMGFYICNVCCVNGSISGWIRFYQMERCSLRITCCWRTACPTLRLPVRSFVILTVTACLFILFSFFKSFYMHLHDTAGFSFNAPPSLLLRPSIHWVESDRLHTGRMQYATYATCCNEGLGHQFHEPSFVSLVPK